MGKHIINWKIKEIRIYKKDFSSRAKLTAFPGGASPYSRFI